MGLLRKFFRPLMIAIKTSNSDQIPAWIITSLFAYFFSSGMFPSTRRIFWHRIFRSAYLPVFSVRHTVCFYALLVVSDHLQNSSSPMASQMQL
jgi:hypothetical protein